MNNLNIAIGNLISEDGIDPHKIYCQVTGQVIGTLSPECFAELIANIPADIGVDDLQSELFIRTLASARPSPAWNKFRVKTFSSIRDNNPLAALSYLINRAIDPVGPHDPISAVHRRIKFMRRLRAQPIEAKVLDSLLMVLLELDARYSLSAQAMPVNLQQLIQLNDWAELTKALNEWLKKLTDKEMRDNKLLFESQRSFQSGNSVTKQAFMQEFIRQQPVSPTRQIEIQKEAKKRDSHILLDAIEEALTVVPANGKPVATPKVLHTRQAPYKPAPVTNKLKPGFKFGGLAK